MPTLDTQGKIAAATLAFYAPVAVISVILVYQYGLRRDAGYIFVFIFALVRLANGALHLAAELAKPQNLDLLIISYTLEAAGLGPLMLSTIGFLGLAGYHSYSDYHHIMVWLRVAGVLCIIGLAITIPGWLLGTHISPKNGNVGSILRRAGAGVFAAVWVLLMIMHFVAWTYHRQMRWYRRRLLIGLSLALPFLAGRAAFAVLAAFSSSDVLGTHPTSNATIAKFNPVTGDWVIVLILSVVTEFIVTATYLLFSTIFSRRRH